MKLVIAAAALLHAAGAGVHAAGAGAVQPPASAPAASPQQIQAETVEIGRWMQRVQAIEADVHQGLRAILTQVQTSLPNPSRGSGERLRQVAEEMVGAIDRADAALAALQPPRLSALAEASAQLPRTVAALRDNYRAMRPLLASVTQLADAIERGDRAAMGRAAQGLQDANMLMMRSQVVMLEAQVAAAPRETAARDLQSIKLTGLRSLERFNRAVPLQPGPSRDESLADDLVAFAAQIDASVESGTAKVDDRERLINRALESARRDGDSNAVATATRLIDANRRLRTGFDAGRQLAATLRSEADRVRGRALRIDDGIAFFRLITPLAVQLDGVPASMAAAMAGTE